MRMCLYIRAKFWLNAVFKTTMNTVLLFVFGFSHSFNSHACFTHIHLDFRKSMLNEMFLEIENIIFGIEPFVGM